jgi:hypothetical protein
VVIQLVITDISTKTNKRLFGQDQQVIAYDSPNAKVIRTDQQVIAYDSPNAKVIRTGPAGNRL